MASGLRAVGELAGLLDVVIEVRDARLPASTSVAALHARLRSKPLFVLLNRADLARPAATAAWIKRLSNDHREAFSGVGTRAATLRALRAALGSYHGRGATTRAVVLGAPNTGKSSVINALARRKGALAADKPGVTRQVGWIRLDRTLELLDTPGVLAPRIVGETAAWQLAACGILPESAFDVEEIVASLHAWALREELAAAARFDLESFAQRRGMLRRGGEIDRRNAARALLKEFRSGALGRFTFELPGEPR